jgi:pimeloyl-ACP methyl ester carboxylesterase/DNA-binding CsgD family transcriptional regulator
MASNRTRAAATDGLEALSQEVRFCRAPDGVRLAYTLRGEGLPIVLASCWLSHLQFDLESPCWRHLVLDFGRLGRLVRYDERGSGLSDWEVEDFSIEARTADLEAVANELGLERFALIGMSQGGLAAITYAARHPERLSHLVLLGCHARGPLAGDPSPERVAEYDAIRALVRVGWAREDALYRHVLTRQMMPGGSDEQMRWFDDLMRITSSTDNVLRQREARAYTDLTGLLPRIRVPTLVLHARGDSAVPFEYGRELAGGIPGARLVPLDTDNHIIPGHDPAWPQLMAELRDFLATRPAAVPVAAAGTAGVTEREREVLELAARGQSNVEIARRLGLSDRTVERHLSNVYVKLGLSGRAARAAAVASFVRSYGAGDTRS